LASKNLNYGSSTNIVPTVKRVGGVGAVRDACPLIRWIWDRGIGEIGGFGEWWAMGRG